MTLLVLGGTAEAREIARALSDMPDVPAILSLAGATRAPPEQPLPTRRGGFGGADGFATYLREAGITATLDATHPYARRIGPRSARVCAELGVPYLRLLRPPWSPEPGDDWHDVQTADDLGALIPAGATVFLATGPRSLREMPPLAGCRVICRRVDPAPAPFPWPGGSWLVARPPFAVAAERAVFADLAIDWLVTKNAGGPSGRAKLEAARALGVPVAMLRRPPVPEGPQVSAVDDALTWVRRRQWTNV